MKKMNLKLMPIILALSLSAAAQTMAGLPGIELSGDAQAPIATNHSGKHILMISIRMEVQGGPETGGVSTFMNHPGFPHGAQKVFPGVHPKGVPPKPLPGGLAQSGFNIPAQGPITRVSIDSALLEDGQFVGPDTRNVFGSVTALIGGYRDFGKSILNGSRNWNDVDALGAPGAKNVDPTIRWVALDLRDVRAKFGEDQAHSSARWYSELSDPWKGESK